MRRRTDIFDEWSKRIVFIITFFTAIGSVASFGYKFVEKQEEQKSTLKIMNNNMNLWIQRQKDEEARTREMEKKIDDIWRYLADRRR